MVKFVILQSYNPYAAPRSMRLELSNACDWFYLRMRERGNVMILEFDEFRDARQLPTYLARLREAAINMQDIETLYLVERLAARSNEIRARHGYPAVDIAAKSP